MFGKVKRTLPLTACRQPAKLLSQVVHDGRSVADDEFALFHGRRRAHGERCGALLEEILANGVKACDRGARFKRLKKAVKPDGILRVDADEASFTFSPSYRPT